jgi:hypothetical protein
MTMLCYGHEVLGAAGQDVDKVCLWYCLHTGDSLVNCILQTIAVNVPCLQVQPGP